MWGRHVWHLADDFGMKVRTLAASQVQGNQLAAKYDGCDSSQRGSLKLVPVRDTAADEARSPPIISAILWRMPPGTAQQKMAWAIRRRCSRLLGGPIIFMEDTSGLAFIKIEDVLIAVG